MRVARSHRSIRRDAFALVAMVATFAACDRNPVEREPDVLEVVVTGWVERGGEVTLTLLRNGEAVPGDQVEWSVDPVEAAELLDMERARLLREGTATVTGRLEENSASASVEVGAPPMLGFDRAAEGNRDLWKVALDGEDLERLTTDAGDDSDPSATAGEIVFVSYRAGNAELYAMPVAGGESRRLTTTSAAELDPTLSPDGAHVAYTSNVAGVSRVWLLTIASGDRAAIPVQSAANDIHASPSWRPASDEIAFVTTAAGSADIHLASTTTGVSQPLVTGPFADVEPAWDPTGTKLAFVSNREGDTELYLLDIATDDIVRLTERPGSDAQPAWLPDGRIVYSATDGAVTHLRWLDPAEPSRSFEIPTGGSGAARATGLP
jgi:hypothetical protein